MIPFGLGSGFEGGITAPHGGVSIDLRRMNQGHLCHVQCTSYTVDYTSGDCTPVESLGLIVGP